MIKQKIRSCQEKFSSVVGVGSVGTFEHCQKQRELQKLFDPFVEYLHNSVFAGSEVCDGSIGRFTDLSPDDQLRWKEYHVFVKKNKETGKFIPCDEKHASHVDIFDVRNDCQKIKQVCHCKIYSKIKEQTERYIIYRHWYKDYDGKTVALKNTIKSLV